jgi:two-component system, chemotaxis family, sensor kinase CheA
MGLDLSQFHESFFEESFEALDAMEASLLKLDVGVADDEGINTIFRGAHSIKGGAGMLGFNDVTSFTHTLETLLDALRSGRMQVTAPILDNLLKSVDVLRDLLRAVKSKQPVDAQRVADLQFDLEMAVANQDKPAAPAPAPAPAPADPKAAAPPAAAPPVSAPPAAAQPAPGGPPAAARTDTALAATPTTNTAAAATPTTRTAAAATPTSDLATSAAPAPAGQPTTAGGAPGWNIVFKPLPHLLVQGNDPLAIFAALREVGPVQAAADLTALPPVRDLDPQQCYISWQLRLESDCAREQVEGAFDWAIGDCDLSIERGAPPQRADTEPATPAENAAAKTNATDGPSSLAPGAESPNVNNNAEPAKVNGDAESSNVSGGTDPAKTPAPEAESGKSAAGAEPSKAANGDSAKAARGADSAKAADSSSIRVGIDKVDELINTVGELVITQAMLSELGRTLEGADAEQLRSGLAQLERNMRQLQESVMRVRMLPISVAFSRFPRMVHDLALRLGKKIELKLAGEHTELDKTVLEKIGDPLVHLVRNSLDHGIETPEVRIANGKPEFGTILLNAYHRGGNIAVEVQDDGAGLDRDRILAKARSRGLVGAHDVLSNEQIHELIFLPGFSTAEKTTDVSGRGVGMDVVRQRVKELGGTVEIQTEPGRGSRFLITLPLTLSIVDGQSVVVGTESYIVPLTSIVESLQLKPQQINRLAGLGEVFWFREEYLPIVRLHQLFGIEPRSRALHDGLIVVAEGDGRRVGLFVDELMGQQQVVIKSMESNYGRVEGVAGATILGDGSVALILDLPGLIRCAAA